MTQECKNNSRSVFLIRKVKLLSTIKVVLFVLFTQFVVGKSTHLQSGNTSYSFIHKHDYFYSTTTSLVYTGGSQSFVVPFTAFLMTVSLIAARGGSHDGYSGGYGAKVTATFPVTGGTTFYVFIGGKGGDTDGSDKSGGFNGGKSYSVDCKYFGHNSLLFRWRQRLL
jgi:hypothetical protein